MGNAGRVLMIPKGEYNAATTYEMLDFVYYNGRSYVCKQTSTGNVPTNTTYWQALTGDASAEIQALTNQVNGNWSEGGKNLLPNTAKTQTVSGVTFTVAKDGTITANGTATANIYFVIGTVFNLVGSFVLNGCPTGGGGSTYRLYTYASGGGSTIASDYGAGASFTLAESTDIDVAILLLNGQTVSNLVFKPMIRLATDADSTYQPYAKTNLELTQDIAVKKLTNYTPTAGTNVTIRGIDIYRSGNTISLLVYIDVTSDLSNNDVVVSFNKDLPKPATLYALGMCKSITSSEIGQLLMSRNTPNKIQAWGALKAGSYYCAPITYLTTE